ncbi:uncharacterized protein Dwil_GK14961 [Drosophila willistoni]|uniref:CUB domain-containing protein n=1 Tax=Drosophila willistoni TaxID=7260 RepID=B4MW13_DROWI|nr:uncharacterized protein Dwil_GK14961 [Drosophila willistoni]
MRHYDIWSDKFNELSEQKEDQSKEEMQMFMDMDSELESTIEDQSFGDPQQQHLNDSYSIKLEETLNQTLMAAHNNGQNRRSKVIHLFPVPVDGECLSDDGRRLGNCFNAYECRQKGGQAKGECAMGFGVCCVFVANCNATITNNITYIVSPNFPSFMPSNFSGCNLKVKMMGEEISQLRIDFYHFSLGQPNRRTGVCDGDAFSINGGPGGEFSICGQNSGQHLYYDVGARALPRQSGTLFGSLRPTLAPNNVNVTNVPAADQLIDINLNLSNRFLPIRLWEIRVAQIPFSQRAPAGCLQYHTGTEGVMQTFNYAENGRHLANQHYRICMRQETEMCSIMYQPCDEQSFRIGGGGGGGGGGAGIGMMGVVNPTNNVAAASTGNNGVTASSVAPGTSSMLSNNTATTTLNNNMTNSSSTTSLMQMMNANASSSAPAADDPSAASSASSSSNAASMSSTTPMPQRSSTVAATTSSSTPAPANDDVEGSGGNTDDDDDDGTFSFFRSPPTTALPGVSRRPRPVGGVSSSGGFDLIGFLRSAFDLRLRRRRRTSRQARQFFSTCTDRITMPCIIEDFIGTGLGPLPGCEPVHCGAQFCSTGVWPCRIESTVTPFYIGVHFGDGNAAGKGSPEDNIGACLRYSQVQCM